jgi:hypothetical protein
MPHFSCNFLGVLNGSGDVNRLLTNNAPQTADKMDILVSTLSNKRQGGFNRFPVYFAAPVD